MKTAERIIGFLSSVVDLVTALALICAGLYSAYALWDNHRIYAAAENVRADMLLLKPDAGADGTDGDSFRRLLEVNPDVCGWLTLDNTQIDYPVLQGKDNLTYINTDVYGNFALAGSIYLDSRSDRSFGDGYSLLYGHHMEKSRMFGDLDLYTDEAFFADNSSGTLILPDRTVRLEIFAVLTVKASEKAVFDIPDGASQSKTAAVLDYVSAHAKLVRRDVTERLCASDTIRILALSTCSPEFTDARTVVLASMTPYLP